MTCSSGSTWLAVRASSNSKASVVRVRIFSSALVEKLQLLLCLLAEGDFLVGQLLRFFFDVDCIVTDALALGDQS